MNLLVLSILDLAIFKERKKEGHQIVTIKANFENNYIKKVLVIPVYMDIILGILEVN